MPTNIFIGEFEQLVLLTLLKLGDQPYALPLRNELSRIARRDVSRGALYRTLDRLEEKGFLRWEVEDKVPDRGGHPRRRFRVAPAGLRALRASRRTLQGLWSGLEEVLG
jgi:DNA-binding PadR family transcriptional regulator